MSPRTRIREEQTEDLSFISEFELNEFFQDVVVTGTETATEVVQTFAEYFPGQGLITAGAGVVVATGTNFVQISATSSSLPLVGDSFVSVVTGTNSIQLYTDAIIAGAGIQVTSGTNTVTIANTSSASVPNAIVGITGNMTVISGSSTTTVSGVVTVTSGIAYVNDSTRNNKTLSTSRPVFSFGYNGLADGKYLNVAGSEHTSTGFPIWRPATITAISAYFPSGPNNKQFEVRKNGTGTSIRTLLVSPTVMSINDAENIDLNKGDYLQVFVVSALTGAQDPVVSIEIAWRLP